MERFFLWLAVKGIEIVSAEEVPDCWTNFTLRLPAGGQPGDA